MISMLTGVVAAVDGDLLVIDVSGVGFAVHVPERVVERVGRVGHEMTVHTHMAVREGDISLYGFETRDELAFFQLLIGVSGIGPRTALAAISSYAPETLRGAIASGDAAALAKVPGIGKKTAQRLVLDLGEKLGGSSLSLGGASVSAADNDVVSALTALGYSLAEARAADQAVSSEVQDVDERILEALRRLGKGF